MRILELTAHVKTISRANGRTATAAAAYRACTVIECAKEGRLHDYRRKAGLEAASVVIPNAGPAWALDRAALWNAAELRERNGSRGVNAGKWKARATTAREVLFGFPAELSSAGRLALAHDIAKHLVEAHGVAVDYAIHAPGKLGDQRNFHCHMMFTTRRLDASGLSKKTREWDSRFTGSRTVTAFRATIAAMMNQALADEGHGQAVHVEHRSLKARGSGTVATKHQGPGKTNAGRSRKARERQAWDRQHRDGQAAQHRQERAELERAQQTAATSKGRDIERRERLAIDAVRTKNPPEQLPSPPGRLARLFQTLTGRPEHAPEPPAPNREQERAIDEVRTTFNAERDRHAETQERDLRDLDDRHRADDRQLDRAASIRADRDRSEEVQFRRDEVEGRTIDRTREQEREHERPHERKQPS